MSSASLVYMVVLNDYDVQCCVCALMWCALSSVGVLNYGGHRHALPCDAFNALLCACDVSHTPVYRCAYITI